MSLAALLSFLVVRWGGKGTRRKTPLVCVDRLGFTRVSVWIGAMTRNMCLETTFQSIKRWLKVSTTKHHDTRNIQVVSIPAAAACRLGCPKLQETAARVAAVAALRVAICSSARLSFTASTD